MKKLMIQKILIGALGLSIAGLASAATADQQLSLTPMASQNSTDQSTANLQNKQGAKSLFGEPGVQDKAAFDAMTKQAMPMTPDQIIQMHRMLNMTKRAAAASPTTPPVPVTTTRMVSLQPGALPPVIRLSQGFVSSLVFVDSTGQPWPVASYDIGNSQAFNVQPPQKGSNTLMIQSMTPYTSGNMAIKLAGMTTPIMLTLIPGQKEVDYRTDLHISASGPNAKSTPGNTGTPIAASDVLLSVLNGVSPKDAKFLQVSDAGTQAWELGNRILLRTKLTILSPAWISMMGSADGTKAYELPKTPSVLVSRDGKIVSLKVEGL